MRYHKLVLEGMTLLAVLGASPVLAAPMGSPDHSQGETSRLVQKAEHEVDQAWEVYHRAALGGTVASPALQAGIEEHLHEARTLVTQAREAAEQGNRDLLERLVTQVRIHTTQAIQWSQERKK